MMALGGPWKERVSGRGQSLVWMCLVGTLDGAREAGGGLWGASWRAGLRVDEVAAGPRVAGQGEKAKPREAGGPVGETGRSRWLGILTTEEKRCFPEKGLIAGCCCQAKQTGPGNCPALGHTQVPGERLWWNGGNRSPAGVRW